MKKQIILPLVLFLLLLPGLAGCGAMTAPFEAMLPNQTILPAEATPPVSDTPATTAPALSQNEALAAIEGSLENIYTQVNPAVVSIQVTQKEEAPAMPQFPGFPFFFGPQTPQSQAPQEFYRHGAGSGFVWDKQGHIVTNNHVIDGADKITVTFADETIASAKVVGTDPDSDLAVLKVDLPAAQLQPVEMGDSTQVKVGQLAVAIGNPFGLENTMTVGFVSALERLLPVSAGAEGALLNQGPRFTIPEIIQTDAPINPGNSGGVLVNDRGQVIGVTAAIESPVRASVGVGFAIPSAIVQKVVPALIKDGHYRHSWLGLSGISLNPELAQAMNLKADQ
ncbi:MAG: trypsin-like peptidase domain-containing protein, partial [Anaerolineae bacterium]|nr:trypsin-like peptidase domain-containing protein [Anaerolineae bacterium]